MGNVKAKPGRKLHYPEKIEAAFRKGTLAAIDDLKNDGEAVTEFVRMAVDREIERRSA